uniref:Uncharacterized protein n=1 Tax=Aegilops tauschii subsp. strangulata TaxID=200361 RepID=A0A453D757_AEGTS
NFLPPPTLSDHPARSWISVNTLRLFSFSRAEHPVRVVFLLTRLVD